MYHKTRRLHRWMGLTASLFLMVIAATGLLLAVKDRFVWLRAPDRQGGDMKSLVDIVPMHEAVEAAFALGFPELREVSDIDRVDYRPSKNIYKIQSREGYREVQVDGATGEILSSTFRGDQLAEDIHDMSFFADWLHAYWLPVIAVLLFLLGLTGVLIFFVPVIRRARFRRLTRGP